MTRTMIPVPGCEDVKADPDTAAVLARRLSAGEITPDELRATLRGEYNAPAERPAYPYVWGTRA